jgi:hypothetical protein
MTDVPPSEAAIEAALNQDWTRAISINQSILSQNPTNTDAMNRLGFAYMKIGKCQDARKVFTEVLRVDSYNKIAAKNLVKLDDIKDHTAKSEQDVPTMSPMSFLEDPGKTKITQCVNVAPQKVISTLHCGQEVFLKPRNHGIEIRDGRQTYLGALPDDISFRLLKMITANNCYRVFIKSIDKNSLTVLVREVSRGKKFAHQPSFMSNTSYQPLTRDVSIEADRSEISVPEEDDSEASPT